MIDVKAAPAAAVSARRGGGSRAAAVGLGAALAVAAALSLALGSRALAPSDVVSALLSPDGGDASVVVRELRLPRLAIALVVGAALGVAGAQLQGLTRNPLADPGLLGVSSGAALGVVVASLVVGAGGAAHAWAALAGAVVATLFVWALAGGGRRRAGTLTLVLAGVATTGVLTALTSAVVVLEAETLDQYRFWIAGSIAGRDAGLLLAVAPFLAAGTALAVLTVRDLDLLALGDDVARGLGARVGRRRAAVLASATLLTAGAVAVAGPLVFVGLLVPHLARPLVGTAHAQLLPASAALGAVLVAVADVVGRLVAWPGEVQVGVITALIGAPFLVVLVHRSRRVVA